MIPRIARADLTAAAGHLNVMAKLHWRRYLERGDTPRRPGHLLTVLGNDAERGTTSVLECRADRGDAHRYCALFTPCRHATTDHDYESFDDGDEMLCPDGGRHFMLNANVHDAPGWYTDTRKCRFVDYCDLTDPIAELELRRGIYIIDVADVDWQSGEVALTTLATVGEPVQPGGGCTIAARVSTAGRLRIGLESDLCDILEARLADEVDYDPEEAEVTINVDPAVYELVRYLEGRPPSDPSALPLETSHRRPIATINTGGLL